MYKEEAKEKFKETHSDLVDIIKNLSKEERDTLHWITRDIEDAEKPRFSCRRGDVLKFWSEWTDFSKGIFKDRIERLGIALGDYDNTDDALCLEYSTSKEKGKGCWRYEPVRGDKFIEIIGHVDLTEWEELTEKMWEWDRA